MKNPTKRTFKHKNKEQWLDYDFLMAGVTYIKELSGKDVDIKQQRLLETCMELIKSTINK